MNLLKSSAPVIQRLALALLAYFALTGCGGLTLGMGTSDGESWAGSLTGSEGSNSVSESLTASVEEDENGNVTGTWSASDGSSGSLTGTVSGSSLTSMTLSITTSATGCQGALTMTGAGTYSGTTLAADVAGSVSCGSAELALNLSD